MSNDEKVRRYLLELAGEMEKVVSSLPEGVDGTVSVRAHYVYLIIQGRRLAAFALVLGSEAPEVVYDGQYIQSDAIPGGMEAQIDYANETVDNIVEFLLSDRNPVEGKSRILGRPYCIYTYGRRHRMEIQKVRLISPTAQRLVTTGAYETQEASQWPIIPY